ncbi:MAG: indole-3-glycerol-phosphate synthase TrpC [Gemmatimonas sp.]|nr:indole-3-glycerol-phosphate synthase TrpC [Gemmatimonas sp.]
MERRVAEVTAVPSFSGALQRPDVAVIAEVKRRSPSKGVLDESLDAGVRAAEYAVGGAAALSILTEPTEFGGSLDDLAAARRAVGIPLLRKDFIVDEVQLLEARLAGASAVLLIARALPADRFFALAAAARSIGLDVLLEVRDEAELERALGVPDGIVGVNNRDLETLVIDDRVSERLLRLVPPGRTAVYESGVNDAEGVRRAATLGADAVLVGSALSVVSSPAEAVRRLTGVPRSARG